MQNENINWNHIQKCSLKIWKNTSRACLYAHLSKCILIYRLLNLIDSMCKCFRLIADAGSRNDQWDVRATYTRWIPNKKHRKSIQIISSISLLTIMMKCKLQNCIWFFSLQKLQIKPKNHNWNHITLFMSHLTKAALFQLCG